MIRGTHLRTLRLAWPLTVENLEAATNDERKTMLLHADKIHRPDQLIHLLGLK